MSHPAVTPLGLARHHVEGARRIVAAQEELVAKIKARGENSADAESLLESFRRSQEMFEDHLARLTRGQSLSA